MSKAIVLLLGLYCVERCTAIGNMTEASMMTLFTRQSRVNVVSFEPLGEHIQLGLDFLLPFLKVPIVRKADVYGNEPALVNINTAALLSTGLLATFGAVVSFLFRKYAVFGRDESFSENRRMDDNVLEYDLWSVLNNFKLVYTNSSGARVDTSLTNLFDTVNETFQKNDIDLGSCIQKAICTRIQLASRRFKEGNSSGVDKIVDGLMGIEWFKHFLRHTFLKDAIESRNALSLSNQQFSDNYCNFKYPQCKWSMPEEYLIDIIRTYLKFT